MADRTQDFFRRLTLPVHPDYDIVRDSGAIDYTPPVVLNNYIILYTNAAIQATEHTVRLNREIEAQRIDLRKYARLLERFQLALLAAHPAPPSATKNLQLTNAYIQQIAATEQRLSELARMEDQVAVCEDAIASRKAEIDNLRAMQEMIDLACRNIQTHLSYVKQEAKMGGRAGT